MDTRREDVKWLVQTLDSLTATRADGEALQEQRLLEELIARYKNLIPSIEMTVVRTELYSKCYVYAKEVKEVRNTFTLKACYSISQAVSLIFLINCGVKKFHVLNTET